ncbi:hypothetical protein SARI_01923 [Salmonella enterica subsp. arizonae serovar 62:z4,z23:-]|uniref:Uncharacterized protein n=1 Tax=Salmonella arizonae (strain ATCC BAA-731 / CDC346-86 / RSK2980) TaxID=41514 RepID=A9MH87_SALAR|nr:hypothetical protein SARI_01923 [Salmonella enterica subsp. arizonae serovar 62:z4,z23:-]
MRIATAQAKKVISHCQLALTKKNLVSGITAKYVRTGLEMVFHQPKAF